MSPEDRLLPPGVIQIHARQQGTPSDVPRDEAFRQVEWQNTGVYIIDNFLKGKDIYYRKPIGDRYIVQTMNPTSPYGYFSLLIVAIDKNSLNPTSEEDRVPTMAPADLPPEVQVEYYRQVLGSMAVLTDTQFPDESKWQQTNRPRVFYFENSTYDITNPKHRLARSIALPHGQVVKYGDWIDTNGEVDALPSFKREQRMLQSPEAARFVEEIKASFTDKGSELVSIAQRKAPPYGYEIATSIHRDYPLANQAQALQNILAIHHEAYAGLAQKQIDAVISTHLNHTDLHRFVVHQPSYRVQMYYKQDGQLAVNISPVILSGRGSIEANETKLYRDPDIPSIYPQDVFDAKLKERGQRVHDLLAA